MHRTRNTILAILMVGAGLAAAPALYAQGTRPSADPRTGHHMMDGGMHGMMSMTGDMRAMADACTNMMQSMHLEPGTGRDQPQHNPLADPDRKG